MTISLSTLRFDDVQTLLSCFNDSNTDFRVAMGEVTWEPSYDFSVNDDFSWSGVRISEDGVLVLDIWAEETVFSDVSVHLPALGVPASSSAPADLRSLLERGLVDRETVEQVFKPFAEQVASSAISHLVPVLLAWIEYYVPVDLFGDDGEARSAFTDRLWDYLSETVEVRVDLFRGFERFFISESEMIAGVA